MSGLDQLLADYLQLRRSLGHQLDDPARLLPSLVALLNERGLLRVTVASAVEWATLVTDPGSSVGPRRMTAVRGFARYLAGLDPAPEIPPLGAAAASEPLARAVRVHQGRHRPGHGPDAGLHPPADKTLAFLESL